MKIERIISIIMILLEQRKVSASKLAEMFEVSVRTIYRDIEKISMAGIPIVTYPGVNGGIGIMETYKFEKRLFSMNDIVQLLSALESIPKEVSNEEILKTLAKVKGLIPKEHKKEIELKSNQVLIDNTPWFGKGELALSIDEIKKAIEENYIISFEYISQDNTKSLRRIEPYQLILKNSIWYIKGYCLEKCDFRIFRISRIHFLKVTNEIFSPRKFNYKENNTPKLNNKNTIVIKLKLHNSLRSWANEFCYKKTIQDCGEDKFFVDYLFIENDFGYSMLLRMGDKCECIEPEYVRLELINRLRNTLSNYNL
ncbi:MAG: helix-turn-helix transcriptional regulator [Clostridium sp.]